MRDKLITLNTSNSNTSRSTVMWMSRNRARCERPALLTSTSICPKCFSTLSKCFWCESKSSISIFRTSTSFGCKRLPNFRHSTFTASKRSSDRAVKHNFTLFLANTYASSLPMPLDAPVIHTTLPLSEPTRECNHTHTQRIEVLKQIGMRKTMC